MQNTQKYYVDDACTTETDLSTIDPIFNMETGTTYYYKTSADACRSITKKSMLFTPFTGQHNLALQNDAGTDLTLKHVSNTGQLIGCVLTHTSILKQASSGTEVDCQGEGEPCKTQ